jgi:hypothetical protein
MRGLGWWDGGWEEVREREREREREKEIRYLIDLINY